MLKLFVALIAAVASSMSCAEPLKLALNWKAEPQFGGFYAAQTQGYYRANHLDVTIIEGGSGTPTIQMLAAGKVDYAIASADEIIIAHDRGAKNLVAVFATFQTNPQGIMTHAERGFTSIEDIMKSDGLLLWQSGLPYAQFFRKRYLPFKVATAPYLGGIGNFQKAANISQQCFVTSEPLAAARAGVKVKTFLIADSGYNPYTTVLVTTSERLQNNRDEVERVVAAVRKGWENYLEAPSATDKTMATLNKAMNERTFAESAQAQRPLIKTEDIKKLGEMTETRWQTLVTQLQDIHAIKKPIEATELFVDL